MTESIPKTSRQWNVTGFDGLESLVYSEQPVSELGDNQVLVRLRGASINFRDAIIPQGKYPWTVKTNVVPGSDGAGVVIAVGKHVTRFKPNDKVVTIINQQHIAGAMTELASKSGLGAEIDGTFRTVGAFDEQGLVRMPEGLSFVEAATLSCAGLSAWNALFGLSGKQLGPGQWLLTQGTGGVSLFAVQFAKLVGAKVISTTSSDKRAQILRKLGADHIINYRDEPEWGSVAKKLTGRVGVDHVVDVAGPTTLKQSAASLKAEGLLVTMGFVGGEGDGNRKNEIPTLLDCWINNFITRGIHIGNRQHMEEMCRAIEANVDRLRPVLDARTFRLDQLKDAYAYLESGNHQGKVGITID